jgi:hypothetical protein
MNQTIIWGMIHVPALPGNINNSLPIQEIVDFCVTDAKILFDSGIDHFFIENFGDSPFPKTNVQPHVIVGLTTIINKIKAELPNVSIGVNVLRNDALSALAIATITDCLVIRVNILTHARLTDQGLIEGCSYNLASYAVQLNSSVEIWADINVKHSYSLADIPLPDAIHDMMDRGGASKIIFTGSRTGMQADVSLLKELVEKKIILPENIVIGSGISEINIHDFLPYAKNFIVGSSLKINNILSNHIDSNKVSKLLSTIKQL